MQHATPKADAAGVEVLKDEQSPVPGRLTITGDPLHEVFALQRLATPAANDCIDFLNDHKDMLTRLSAPRGTCVANSEPEVQLTDASRQLLHDVVCKSSGSTAARIAANDADVEALKTFPSQANVLRRREWLQVFQAIPPRGVAARLARRFDVSLRSTAEYAQYSQLSDFREEIDRMQEVYTPGRKHDRPQRGIPREEGPAPRVKGTATVFNQAVRQHYGKLRGKNKLEGLWKWAQIAAAIHEAQIPLHSGTVAVERLWSQFDSLLPAQGRRVSQDWFQFLSHLIYIRYNYLHFHSRSLPSWTDNDSLLAQRLDGTIALASALSEEGTGLLQELPSEAEDSAHLEEPEDMLEPVEGSVFWDASLEEEAFGFPVPNAVYMRVLDTMWSTALADGSKWAETQRYRKANLNMMKFAQSGMRLVFGCKAGVSGVAVFDGQVQRGCTSVDESGVLDFVRPHLHGALRTYLQDGASFDFVQIRAVHDLRAANLRWQQLWDIDGCSKPGNLQGFKNIGGNQLARSLVALLQRHGVHRMPYD